MHYYYSYYYCYYIFSKGVLLNSIITSTLNLSIMNYDTRNVAVFIIVDLLAVSSSSSSSSSSYYYYHHHHHRHHRLSGYQLL